MIKEGKLGVHEVVCLLTVTLSSKVFFSSAGFLVRFSGTASWYMTAISNLVSIAAFSLVYLLLKRFPGKNIVEIFESSMGRFFGFIFSLAFGLLFFQGASVILREFTEVQRIFSYTGTPTSLIIGAMVTAAFIAVFLGLESIARVSKLFAYTLLFIYLTLIILGSKNFDYKFLFPILGNGLDITIVNGLKRSSAYTEIMLLTVFAGSLQGIKHIKKAGYISLILSGSVYIVTLLCLLLTFPYVILQEFTSPLYILSRIIRYGTFFERLDSLFMLLWVLSSIINISILLYSVVSIYCKIFRLQDSRPVVVSMSVLLFASAMAPRDFSSIVYGSVQQLREYGWIIFYGLPVISLIAAVLRKKKGEGVHA